MSEPGPPETRLESARRHLTRRGYLGGAPAGSDGWRWRGVFTLLGWAVTLAAVAALSAVVVAAAPAWLVVPATAAFLPVILCLVGVGGLAGWLLARALLRLGAEPPWISTVLAGATGIAVAGGVVGLTGSAASTAWPQRLAVTLAALAVATLAAVAVRLAAARRLSLRRHEPAERSPVPALAFAAALGVGAVLVVLAAPRPLEPAAAAAAFPRPVGRLAVVAVDGLSREDLEAAAAGRATLGNASAWGWAPLTGIEDRLPAVAWTTVACGVEAGRHGVEELEEVRLFGVREGLPLSRPARRALLAAGQPFGAVAVVARPALERRYPTFWEMASRAGCPVLVGGWWGSWPVRRVLGEVASERAWLGGSTGVDAVTPGLAPAVQAAWRDKPAAATGSDRLALELSRRAADAVGPHLVAVALPALDVVQRSRTGRSPVALAAALTPHLDVLARVITDLQAGGYRVWLVGVPWHGGTPFVAASAARPEQHPEVGAVELAGTWLDALALPVPAGGPRPRRELEPAAGPVVMQAGYGAPPPLLAEPPPSARAVQRELLRSLGYLQ
jgi:hypothetical protein